MRAQTQVATAPGSVAVVIATFRRPDLLARTLESIASQTRAPDEIVVVDDASGDRTAEVLDRAAAASAVPFRVLRTARNSGPAVARNLGWRATGAEVVAFTDDDCRPAPKWLELLMEGLEHADIAQGRIRPDPDQLDRGRPFTRSLDVKGSAFFETANIAFRRSLLEALGGFDEGYRHQGGEDTDLGQRALQLGATRVYVPDAEVLHEVFPLGLCAAVRNAGRCDQLIQAVVRHPSLHHHFRTRFLLLPHHPRTLAALAGGLVAGAGVAIRRSGPAAAAIAGGLLLAAPWVHYRIRRRPTVRGRARRVVALPSQLLVELAEIVVVLRARHRYRHRRATAGRQEVAGDRG